MDRRMHDTYQVLCKIAAGSITTSYAGNQQTLDIYNSGQIFDGLGTGTDPVRPAFANELVLYFLKTQGSADEILLQVQESDDDFTTTVVVPIMGQEYFVITSAKYTDAINYRIPIAVQLRGKKARVVAKYSGGAATSAAIEVRGKVCPTNEFSSQGAVSVVGPSGMAAEVKLTDLVIDKGLAYSSSQSVTGGTWAANVVTFTVTGHGYDVSSIVTVSSCGNANYDGTYTILTVPTTDTFTAALVGDPGAFTTAGSVIQAQSTTRLVDENKSWTADAHSGASRYVEITSGTGDRQYAAITDNGNKWIAFSAMTTAPVTSDSDYKIIELNVPGLVVNTELDVKVGSIAVNSIENYKYIVSPPDLAAGATTMGRADIKGNVQVVGPDAHDAAVTRAPLLAGAYASDVIQTAVSAADAVRLWASLSGALCTAGLYQHATPASAVAMTNPVVIDDAIMFTGATAIPVAGQYNATALTYTDKDACVLQMNSSGGLITTGGVGGGTPVYGRKTIAVPGTEEPIHADSAVTDGFCVTVKALHTNTNPVVIGANGLNTATGFELYPGESQDLAVTNLNLIYLDVTTAGEGVSFIVEG